MLRVKSRILNRIIWGVIVLFIVMIIGTFGFWIIGENKYPIIDCIYMTVITITTIGFREVIDISNNTGGKIFAMLIGITGIGTLAYILSNITAVIVEGELKQTFIRRKMEKSIFKFENHYIICGAGRVGSHILHELYTTGRPAVVVENNENTLKALSERYREMSYVKGDADEEEILNKAGIKKAKGIFVATGDDNENLVISLTAKYLNPNVKVVTRCLEHMNADKIKRSGADSVIAENYTAGLSMVSEMIRPTVVGLLEKMMADTERNLRVEELNVGEKYEGKKISELNVHDYPNTLLMAIISDGKWTYIPKQDYALKKNDKLVVITTPEERIKLKAFIID